MQRFNIIDSHCHIYPEKIAQKATDSTDKFYGIHHSPFHGTTEELLKQSEEAGIKRMVVQSVATTEKQVSSINHFIADEVKKHPDKFIGFGTLHPDSSAPEEDVKELISLGLSGVKLHPDIQNFKIDDYRCLKIYELCEKYHLPVLMHTGDSRYDNSNPNRLLPVMEIYTDLIVIGAHFGGYSLWEEASEKLAGLPNLYVDTCSSFFALDKKTALKIIKRYGTDKVIFATDFPMWRQEDELNYITSLGLSDEDLKKIFHDNIMKILNIQD
ncbi:MAG: amidohydrolase [Clostridia bacterium]|nr:amidohydrolase [Clostridia bacterium]